MAGGSGGAHCTCVDEHQPRPAPPLSPPPPLPPRARRLRAAADLLHRKQAVGLGESATEEELYAAEAEEAQVDRMNRRLQKGLKDQEEAAATAATLASRRAPEARRLERDLARARRSDLTGALDTAAANLGRKLYREQEEFFQGGQKMLEGDAKYDARRLQIEKDKIKSQAKEQQELWHMHLAASGEEESGAARESISEASPVVDSPSPPSTPQGGGSVSRTPVKQNGRLSRRRRFPRPKLQPLRSKAVPRRSRLRRSRRRRQMRAQGPPAKARTLRNRGRTRG